MHVHRVVDEDFQAHFIAGEHPPPVFVYDVAAALVADRKINAGWTTYQVGSNSSQGNAQRAAWRSWLVLDGSIAHFEVVFDTAYYDEYEDRDRGEHPVPGLVTQCWQRHLDDVVGFRITGFGPVAKTPRRWGALHGVELSFANGQVIELPGENGLHALIANVRTTSTPPSDRSLRPNRMSTRPVETGSGCVAI